MTVNRDKNACKDLIAFGEAKHAAFNKTVSGVQLGRKEDSLWFKAPR